MELFFKTQYKTAVKKERWNKNMRQMENKDQEGKFQANNTDTLNV